MPDVLTRGLYLNVLLSFTVFSASAVGQSDCGKELVPNDIYLRFVSNKSEVSLRMMSNGTVAEFWMGRLTLDGDLITPPMQLLITGPATFDPTTSELELHGSGGGGALVTEYPHLRVHARAWGTNFFDLTLIEKIQVAYPYTAEDETRYMPILVTSARYDLQPGELNLPEMTGPHAREILDLPGMDLIQSATASDFRRLYLGKESVNFGRVKNQVQLAYALRGLIKMGLRRDHPIFETLQN